MCYIKVVLAQEPSIRHITHTIRCRTHAHTGVKGDRELVHSRLLGKRTFFFLVCKRISDFKRRKDEENKDVFKMMRCKCCEYIIKSLFDTWPVQLFQK